VALERPLTCATGLCHGCPVPVLDDQGDPHVVRACVDGPVFRAGRVDWEALG
jgi:dihydroorotate dehydrogenase electron transfer subunit